MKKVKTINFSLMIFTLSALLCSQQIRSNNINATTATLVPLLGSLYAISVAEFTNFCDDQIMPAIKKKHFLQDYALSHLRRNVINILDKPWRLEDSEKRNFAAKNRNFLLALPKEFQEEILPFLIKYEEDLKTCENDQEKRELSDIKNLQQQLLQMIDKMDKQIKKMPSLLYYIPDLIALVLVAGGSYGILYTTGLIP